MASASLISRHAQIPTAGVAWLLVACGLLGSGCSQPAPSTGPLATSKRAHVSRDDSLVLFPHGPDFKLSAEAEAILPQPLPASRTPEKTRVGGSSLVSVTSSWPRRRPSHSATTEPLQGSPLRMAERLDPGAATVR